MTLFTPWMRKSSLRMLPVFLMTLVLTATTTSSTTKASAFTMMITTTATAAASKSTTTRTTTTRTTTSATPTQLYTIRSSNVEQDKKAQFLQNCELLCEQRNLVLDKVKNARDLASIPNSGIQPGRIFRMGRVSDATDHDMQLLFDELHIKTLVDLRSPTELKDDPTLMRDEVFHNFTNVVWKEQGRKKAGKVKELPAGEEPVQRMFQWFRRGKRSVKNKTTAKDVVDVILQADDVEQVEQVLSDHDDDHDEEGEDHVEMTMEDDELCTLDCDEEHQDEDSSSIGSSNNSHSNGQYIPGQNRQERHFVSLMNEFKYVKGTVGKVRKRDITKSILKSPGALLSRRVRSSCKKPFLDEINDGGLHMLNELLLRFGAPGIRYVLELCADTTRHPVAFYCTAGKDRTGMIAALILALCGVKSEDIVEDYTLSANVYAEMNDHTAMVGALSQRNLNPETFLGAPPQVMRDTLLAIEEEYGSVEGYCDWIGFGPEQREKLRQACMAPKESTKD